MKRFLLALLTLIVIVGVLAGVGFAGYRYGFQQGALVASKGETVIPPFARGDDFHWKRMPIPEFGEGLNRNFHPGFGPGGFGMRPRGLGFGFFSPIRILVQLAVLGFVVWLVYMLLTGWRLSFTRATPENPRVEPVQPVESETRPTEEQSN